MPEYLPQLIESIRKNRDLWQRGLEGQMAEEARELLGPLARLFWHEIPVKSDYPPDGVVGSDGSQSERMLWSGTIWWVVRAVALSEKHRTRVLSTGFAPPGTRKQDFDWYLTVKMEDLEHRAALQGLKDIGGNWLLLDGSLFGRLQHLPVDSPIFHDRLLLLDYYDALLDLIDYCRKNGVGVISISKDSRARHLGRYLIHRAMTDVFDSISPRPSLKIRRRVHDVVLSGSASSDDTDELVKDMKSKRGKTWKRAGSLLELGMQVIPDHVLMQYLMMGEGFTTPILLAMSDDTRKNYVTAFRDPTAYSRTRFKLAINEAESSSDMRRRIAITLRRLEDAPAIISFHTRLHPQDTPLRIDLPAWMIGVKKRLWEPIDPEATPGGLNDVFDVLTGGYGGLQNYNIWQTRADAHARLSRDTVDSLYREVMEKELGTRIQFDRGYRRVYYP